MKATPRQNLVAASLAVALLAALGARLWAHAEAAKLAGPDHIAALGGDVYVHFNRTLYHLSAEGQLVRRIPLSALGVEGYPADLQVLSDGGLLVGDLERRMIRRCEMETLACRAIAPSDGAAIKRQFKFYLDEVNEQLYITDTSRHRLLVQHMGTRGMQELAGRKTLRFPNQLQLGADGLLWIADTNRHRVVALEADADAVGDLRATLAGKTELTRPGCFWPIAFASGPDGTWWVLNADAVLANAELIVYLGTEANRRIELPQDADPVAIVRVGDRLLMTDREHLQVYGVDPETDLIAPFGASEFQQVLGQLRISKRRYQDIASLSLAALVLFGLGLFLLAAHVIRKNQAGRARAQRPASLNPVPMARLEGVDWLEPDRQLLGKLRQAIWLLVVVVIGLLVVGVTIYFAVPGAKDAARLEEVKVIGVWLIYVVSALTILLFFAMQMFQRRIGTDGELLYFADHRGLATAVPPEQVVYTKRQLAAGAVVIPLMAGHGQPLFPPLQFQERIEPLLARAQKLGEVNMMIYQLMAGQPLQVFLLVAVIVGFFLLLGAPQYWMPLL